jgi:hypothetical protein
MLEVPAHNFPLPNSSDRKEEVQLRQCSYVESPRGEFVANAVSALCNRYYSHLHDKSLLDCPTTSPLCCYIAAVCKHVLLLCCFASAALDWDEHSDVVCTCVLSMFEDDKRMLVVVWQILGECMTMARSLDPKECQYSLMLHSPDSQLPYVDKHRLNCTNEVCNDLPCEC